MLDEKDKRLRTKERQLNKREESVEMMELQQRNQAQQNAALKTLVTQMEKEMLEIKEENRLLLIQVRATGRRNLDQDSTPTSYNTATTMSQLTQAQRQLSNTIQTQLVNTMQSLNTAITNLTAATEKVSSERKYKFAPKKEK